MPREHEHKFNIPIPMRQGSGLVAGMCACGARFVFPLLAEEALAHPESCIVFEPGEVVEDLAAMYADAYKLRVPVP